MGQQSEESPEFYGPSSSRNNKTPHRGYTGRKGKGEGSIYQKKIGLNNPNRGESHRVLIDSGASHNCVVQPDERRLVSAKVTVETANGMVEIPQLDNEELLMAQRRTPHGRH